MIFQFNQTFFLWFNAAADAPRWSILLGTWAANGLIFLLPLVLASHWLRGDAAERRAVAEIFGALLVALAVSEIIRTLWPLPRPFMMQPPVGNTFAAHTATAGFPSNHATLMCAATFGWFLNGWRTVARVALTATLATMWGRVYIGVHFPIDMLAGLITGVLAYAIWFPFWRIWGETLLMPTFLTMHNELFAYPIRWGWVFPATAPTAGPALALAARADETSSIRRPGSSP